MLDKFFQALILYTYTEAVMRILILIFSLIFSGSGIAQGFSEYGFAMMTDSKCDNH